MYYKLTRHGSGFAKMADLSRAQQSTLIELYRTHSVLWDNSLSGYKDQIARNKALAKIQTAFEAQWGIKLEINDIKTKLQSFRSITSREMSKVYKSQQSGAGPDDVYTPTYIHWHELQFLTKVIKKRELASTLVGYPDLQSQGPAAGPVKLEEDHSLSWLITSSQRDDDSQTPGSPTSSSPSPSSPPLPVQFQIPTPSQMPPQQPQPSAASSSSITASMSKKRKDLADETAMGSMHQYFQNKSARVQSAATEDAYSIWGKSLIEDLKKVKSENKRTVLQITINRLVQDEILKQIEQESGETLSN